MPNVDTPAKYQDAYTVSILDDSMSPRVKRGLVAHVSPTMAPSPGDLVVVKVQTSDGIVGYLRNLFAIDEKFIVVSQLNPPRTDTIPRFKVIAVDRVFQVGVADYM